jgi:hypothetical protein
MVLFALLFSFLFALAWPATVMAADGGIVYFPCPFMKEGKKNLWGYIDQAGKVIIKPQYHDAGSFSEGLAKVMAKNGKIGFIDVKGRMVIKPTFDDSNDFHDGMVKVFLGGDGRFGYIDKKGSMVVPPRYEEQATDFSEGLAFVQGKGKKGGFIDKKGRYAIEPVYDRGWPFSEGLAAVRSDGKWGYINKGGEFVIEPTFDRAWPFSEGLAAVSLDGQKWGFIDKSGKMRIEPKIEGSCGKMNLAFSDGLICVKMGDDEGFMDKQGNLVIDTTEYYRVWDFQEGLAGVVADEQAERFMYIDKTGKPVFEATFDVAEGWLGPFSREGVAKFCRGLSNDSYEGCGFIDRHGQFTIKPVLMSGGY